MDAQSSDLSVLREQARRQGVEPTDEDLEAVLGFFAGILPALAELEQLLPEDAAP